MPRIVSEVPQVQENILRPVAIEVARQLVRMFNLPADIRVLLPGVTEVALNPKTALETQDPGDSVTFGHNGQLLLEVIDTPIEDRILTTAVHQEENVPFFWDDELKVRMYPVYSGTELAFNFTFRAENRTSAKRFYNEILTRTAAMREAILHEINYYYQVPYVFLHLLKHIHTLRETIAPYGEDFDHWVSNHITNKATNLTNQIGTNQTLAIREFQSTPYGVFQFIGATEVPEKDKPSGTWNVTFQYKFYFDQVVSAVAEWPLMVHNQLIDETWRSQPWASGELVDPNRRKRQGSHSRNAFDQLIDLFPTPCQQRIMDGITIPNFDEWRPNYVIPNTSTLVCAMVGLDPTAPSTLFSLQDDLDGYVWDEDILAFLKQEARYMTTVGASIFDLRLYEEENPMDDNLLVVGNDLIVSSPGVLNLRKNYHVRFALVNDLFTLSPGALERFRLNGKAAVKILNCLQYKLFGNAYTPTLLGGKVLKDSDLKWIAQRINDKKVPHKGPLEHVMLTVSQVLIQANRSSDNGADQKRSDGAESAGPYPGENPLTNADDCHC